MSMIEASNRAKLNSYQDTVINYITKENGHILAVSDDQAFCTQLRLTLAKEMGLYENDLDEAGHQETGDGGERPGAGGGDENVEEDLEADAVAGFGLSACGHAPVLRAFES